MSTKKSVTPLWEKIVGGLGLVLLGAGFIYLTYTAITNEKSPPVISFYINSITKLESNYLVTVDVYNSGSETATSLHVEGALLKNNTPVETYDAQIDYIPSSSTRNIGFFFQHEPKVSALEFRALSYQKP